MALLVACAVALVVTPAAGRLARALGIVDHPGPLKLHRAPVPYLGGLAVLIALAGPVAIDRPGLLVPLAAACALGVADDHRHLPPLVRLVCELAIGVAAGLVAPAGAQPVGAAVTALAVLGLVNAVNLLDGLDGLAGGVACVSAAGFACLGGPGYVTALALAGALAGFLVFNRPPARIYLGDGGSYLVGATLALLGALALDDGDSSAWVAVPLLVAVPVADTAIAVLRRVLAHRPLLEGDRGHTYDQLVDRGLSTGRAVLVVIAAQVVLAALGLAAARVSIGWASALGGSAACAVAATAWFGGFLAPPSSQLLPEQSP